MTAQVGEKAPELIAEEVSGAHAIMQSLVHHGVQVIFGYPGGAIMPAYDALYDYREKIRHVLVRHEQGAAHAAEGFARISGKAGVCLVTSGPGATNLVTGIADAMMDSVPLVCLTGQVGRWFLGTDAFQETDVIGVTMPITKWNYQITEANEIPFILAKAFSIATQGRPGPVVIDITKNAQIEKCAYRPVCYSGYKKQKNSSNSETALKEAADLINQARRPYILAGHGILISHAQEALSQVAEKAGIPVALTLHGLSAFPAKHPLCVGMLGMHGHYAPNILTNEADVIVAVGMRFDDRVTGNLSKYAPDAKVVHIDIDQAEINKNVPATIGIVGDAKSVLEQLEPLLNKNQHPEWIEQFRTLHETELEKIITPELNNDGAKLNMSEVIAALSQKTRGEAVVVADVGQHQMAAARYYQFERTDSWISSGGLGTMGFAVPAALGAAFAAPDRVILAIVGDGGFQMTCQELGTIAQERLPVKIVILNNNYLGMVRQWQEMFFDGRYSFVHLQNPDFVKLGEAFGITSARVSERTNLSDAIDRMLNTSGPYLLEIEVEKEGKVFPMVPAGAGVAEIRLE